VIEIDLNFALAIEWLQKAIVLDTSWIGGL